MEMVLTRYQAAFAQFLGRGDPNVSEDDEITLNISNEADGSDLVSVTGSDMEGQDDRLAAVENTVKDINSKFDSLLAAVSTEQNTHQTSHTDGGRRGGPPSVSTMPARAAPGPNMYTPAGVPPPTPTFPHQASLQGPGYDDYVLAQLRREEFYAQRSDDGKGFANDIYTKALAPIPYLNVSQQARY